MRIHNTHAKLCLHEKKTMLTSAASKANYNHQAKQTTTWKHLSLQTLSPLIIFQSAATSWLQRERRIFSLSLSFSCSLCVSCVTLSTFARDFFRPLSACYSIFIHLPLWLHTHTENSVRPSKVSVCCCCCRFLDWKDKSRLHLLLPPVDQLESAAPATPTTLASLNQTDDSLQHSDILSRSHQSLIICQRTLIKKNNGLCYSSSGKPSSC